MFKDQTMDLAAEATLLETAFASPTTDEAAVNPLDLRGEESMNCFASINVTALSSMSKLVMAKFEARSSDFVGTGNSRDLPTRFLFNMTELQILFSYI